MLSPRRTFVRPHPSEKGVFLLQRGDVESIVVQGFTRIGGAAIKYTYERPVEATDPVPLIVVPGYGGIKPAYRELRKAVVQHGKPAVTFRPPRSQERFAGLHPKHFLHPERLLAQSVTAITRDMLNQHGVEHQFDQVDSVGHSMGGPAVVNAALVHPGWYRSVTAMGAAGLDGHTLKDMGKRAPAVFRDEIIPALSDVRDRRDRRAVRDMGLYVWSNPWRTLAEGLAVGSGDIRDKVSHLGALGLRTAALQFPKDRFFPVEGVREHSADRFSIFRVFPDKEANHMWPQLEPEAVAEELINIIHKVNSDRAVS